MMEQSLLSRGSLVSCCQLRWLCEAAGWQGVPAGGPCFGGASRAGPGQIVLLAGPLWRTSSPLCSRRAPPASPSSPLVHPGLHPVLRRAGITSQPQHSLPLSPKRPPWPHGSQCTSPPAMEVGGTPVVQAVACFLFLSRLETEGCRGRALSLGLWSGAPHAHVPVAFPGIISGAVALPWPTAERHRSVWPQTRRDRAWVSPAPAGA